MDTDDEEVKSHPEEKQQGDSKEFIEERLGKRKEFIKVGDRVRVAHAIRMNVCFETISVEDLERDTTLGLYGIVVKIQVSAFPEEYICGIQIECAKLRYV